jgi:hypothetical protein
MPDQQGGNAGVMSWLDQVVAVREAAQQSMSPDGWAILLGAIAVSLILVMGLMWRRRMARAGDMAPSPVGDETDVLEDLTPLPADRLVPLGRIGFLALIVGICVSCWAAGYLLATDKTAFLGSKEWQFQPFYIAAHLVTLRLFVAVFARNFRQGITWLDVQADVALAGMHRILGPAGAAVALGIAVPFCISDFRYLYSARYERLDTNMPIGAIDHVMWGIWSVEWFLNAFIWVILVGFLVKNVEILRKNSFTAPIERVLQEKHYRPFLRMSSQGAGVVLGFSIMTVLYIGYTGGAITDYMGLAITATLLVIGFLVPWFLLKRKLRASVDTEQGRLQSSLGQATAALAGPNAMAMPPQGEMQALSQRLDYVVSLMRINHLERLHLKVGSTEARAVALRLLAPAATILWQLLQNYKPAAEMISRILKLIVARLAAMAG